MVTGTDYIGTVIDCIITGCTGSGTNSTGTMTDSTDTGIDNTGTRSGGTGTGTDNIDTGTYSTGTDASGTDTDFVGTDVLKGVFRNVNKNYPEFHVVADRQTAFQSMRILDGFRGL